MLSGQALDPSDRRMQQLGVGRKGDVLGLHAGVHRHPLEIARSQRTAFVRHPQALGQQKFQLVAEPLAPMAQVRTLARKLTLEKLPACEVLEVRVVHPTLAHALIGQSVDVLEQQQPHHKTALDPRPTLVAIERCNLPIDPIPIHLAASCTSSCFRLMICSSLARNRSPSRRRRLLRSHRALRMRQRKFNSLLKGTPKMNLQASQASNFKSLQYQTPSRGKSTPAQWLPGGVSPSCHFFENGLAQPRAAKSPWGSDACS